MIKKIKTYNSYEILRPCDLIYSLYSLHVASYRTAFKVSI